MNKEKEKLFRYKKKNSKPIYSIPNNYFNDLNHHIDKRINIVELNAKFKVVFYKRLFKVAAAFIFIIGFYSIFNYFSKNENISYVQLNKSIDEYLAVENEIFYTFINDEDFNHLNMDQNIDDYFEIEIDL